MSLARDGRCARCGSLMGNHPHNCISVIRYGDHLALQDRVKELERLLEEGREDFNYRDDWAGETRNDILGNTFVLRGVGVNGFGEPAVRINDIFGGHEAWIPLEAWLKWEVHS